MKHLLHLTQSLRSLLEAEVAFQIAGTSGIKSLAYDVPDALYKDVERVVEMGRTPFWSKQRKKGSPYSSTKDAKIGVIASVLSGQRSVGGARLRGDEDTIGPAIDGLFKKYKAIYIKRKLGVLDGRTTYDIRFANRESGRGKEFLKRLFDKDVLTPGERGLALGYPKADVEAYLRAGGDGPRSGKRRSTT